MESQGKMRKTHNLGLAISIILFGLGMLLGTAFNLRVAYAYLDLWSFWGYPETIPYDYSANDGEFSITGFHCPQLLTPGETDNISIRITNKSDGLITPVIQILVSEPEQKESYTRFLEEFALLPGESKEFTQALSSDNSLVNYVSKVRIFFALNRKVPASMTRHCPVFSYQVGNLKGTQILILLSALTFGLCASGIGLFWKNRSEAMKRDHRAIKTLIGLVGFMGITMLSNLLEFYFLALIWILAAIFLALAIFESDRVEAIFR